MFAVIEHASRHIRIPGATGHPAASWMTQAAKNIVVDLEGAGYLVRFLIRDGKYPALFDTILADAGDRSRAQRRSDAENELDVHEYEHAA